MDRYVSGDVDVTCLVDGSYDFDDADFPEVTPEARAQRLAAAGLTTIRTDFNAYILRHAGGIDLVDTGCADHFGPGAGRLPELLAAEGVAPDAVDRIILTHLHTDHAGGLLRQGAVAFPRAELVMHAAEQTYWQGRDEFRDAVLAAYAGRIRTVQDGADLGHGMRVWALPGHTPGHIGLHIGAGLVLIGDVIHSEALQFRDPGTRNANDIDRITAAASRRACLDRIAADGLVWSGSHMLGPAKFARLKAVSSGYERVAL